MRKCLLGFLVLTLAMLLLGCEHKKDEFAIYTNDDRNDVYSQIIEDNFSDFDVRYENRPTAQLLLERGKGLITYDVLAESVIQADENIHWYPHYVSTVVIAVDRALTSEKISSWQELFHSSETIGMSKSYMDFGYLISAMAYGVEQGEMTYSLAPKMTYDAVEFDLASKAVVEHLAQRQSAKTLVLDSVDQPILVLMDYEAIELIRSGRKLHITIPEEGTLSFRRGLLIKGDTELPSSIVGKVQAAGLRTEDSSGEHYPSEREYARAVFPEDFEEIEQNIIRSREYLNRTILRTHRYTTATGRDHSISALAGMALFVLWTGSAINRSMKRDISVSFFVIGFCLVGWLFVRFIKWQVATDTLANRYLWYSYYIFLLTIPSFFFWISISINKNKDKKMFPAWFKGMLGVYSLLLLFVYTNDFHQFVFAFDKNSDFWTKDYKYMWGYWIVFSSFASTTLASVVTLCIKCWKSTIRVRIFLPVTVILFLAVYMYSYVNHIPIVFYGDMVLTSCLFILAFGETAIQTNLLPLNTKYSKLFDNSSLDMQILSNDGAVHFQSHDAEKIPELLTKNIIEGTKPLMIKYKEGMLLRANSIIGGVIVWRENVRELFDLRQKISRSVYLIEHTNSMLSHRSKISAEREAVRARTLLNQQLHQEVGDQLERLDLLAKELQQLEENGRLAEYELTLAEINLTTVYIKRRCNFIFYVEQNQMSANALVTYISELLEYAQPLGIKSASALGVAGTINTRSGILLYDFCFSVLSFLSREEQVSDLMMNFRIIDEKYRLLFISETDFATYQPSKELIEQISDCQAMLLSKNLDELHSLQIEIPLQKEDGLC